MVNTLLINPIYIIGAGLGAAFFIGFFKKAKSFALLVMFAVLAFMTFLSFNWLAAFLFSGQQPLEVFTAGFKPPFSINLLMGREEAFFTLAVNLVGLLGGLYLMDRLKDRGNHAISVYVVLIMGLNGIILTRDIFNLFVFLEITSIATAGLIALSSEKKTLGAGFKYMIATGLISGFLLLGIIFAYYFGGTLNIDSLAASNLPAIKGGIYALFLIVTSMILELKPFPANGWAIDVYDAAPAGLNSILSAASAAAAYYALSKVMVLGGTMFHGFVAAAGLVTFVGSNLAGIKQSRAKRLLGYSSVGQIGLLLIVLGLGDVLGDKRDFIALGIFVSHYLAKAVLFWLAGMFKSEDLKSWAVLRRKPLLMVMFGFGVFALAGLPPFPSFFAKWEMIMAFGKSGLFVWSALILIGSFFEAVYLFRWFGYALKSDNSELEDFKSPFHKWFPTALFAVLLLGAGYYASLQIEAMKGISYLPLLFILILSLIDWLPVWIKNIISLSGVGWYIWDIYPRVQGDTLHMIFAGVFLVGAVLTLISGFYYKGKRAGFYPMAITMFLGLITLVEATNLFQFFWGWELMTIGSYFLLIRGKKSAPHGYSYMLFSLGGGYALIMAFSLAFASAGHLELSALTDIALYPAVAYSLLFLGFMTKTASLPMHIWLPGAHGEADTDVSVMASAILLKAGVFGIVLTLLGMGADAPYAKVILTALVWIGAFSALVGNISAAMQENGKRLLAWSSIGQLGIILFGLATMTHLGWLVSLAMVVAHFMYKSILFFMIGGVGYRVGTKEMYKMGGLIKRMPLAFTAVLISIIALSGVPPLVGYAAKWIAYNILVTEGFVVPGTLMIIAGLVAFLYLFRLIHTVFLGQQKDNLRNVKEVNFWFILPSYMIIAVVMYLSTLPNALLKPIGEWVVNYFPDGAIHWVGTRGTTAAGYFDGLWIMYVIGGIFGLLLVISLIISSRKKLQKVKQFNIFYSGEHPSRPELAHVSYNFFAHYNKAVGFVITPVLHHFWDYMAKSLHGVSDFVRRIYNGNGQSYAFHLIAYVVLLFLFQGVM